MVENIAVLYIGIICNFEKEVALEDSAFSWVLCLSHIRFYDIRTQIDSNVHWPGVGR